MMLQFSQMAFPEMYEAALVGPLFRPWAEDLLVVAGVTRGDRLLDVACGTGIVARTARERVGVDGKVVGVDVNPAMLTVARDVAPEIDWRAGSADALPVAGDERFDVVTCQQGIQFFPDRSAAVREFRRVLAPDGRVAASAWRSDEEAPFLRELRRIAERHVGPVEDKRHCFGEISSLEALFRDAGFSKVDVVPLSRTVHFPDGSDFVHLNVMALVGMSRASRDLADDERQRIVAAIVSDSHELRRAHTSDDGLAYEISANVATASHGA